MKKYIVIMKAIKFFIRTLNNYLIEKNNIHYSIREKENFL